MDGRDILRLEPLRVEMQPKGGQQEYVREGVEVAYVGRHVVAGSVTEASDDCLGADEQAGGDIVYRGPPETLTLLAEVFVIRVDNGVHP